MWDRKQVLAHFAAKADDWIKNNPPAEGEFRIENIPQHAGREELLELARAMQAEKPIASVLDLGGGVGRWVPFWLEGVGAKKVTVVEPVEKLASEASRRWEPKATVEVIEGDLIDLDGRLGKRRWDLGFTFTVLEHVPPSEIAAVAAILRKRCRRLMLIEMVTATAKAGFCDYVFKHDYEAVFGAPKFSRMVDENKALMIFGG